MSDALERVANRVAAAMQQARDEIVATRSELRAALTASGHTALTGDDGELVERLRKLLDYDFGDESGHCIDLAVASGALLDRITALTARVEQLEEDHAFVFKWVERGLFDKHTQPYDALETIAYYPSAPWNNGRWDVDHKPYADKFYKTFPNARAALSTIGGE